LRVSAPNSRTVFYIIIAQERTMPIEHIFVVLLENRSFDHMLGFSGITGTESNSGVTVHPGADLRMPTDPDHEFENVVHQLCGNRVAYPAGGPYPPIDNSGFVDSYVGGGGADPQEVMKCYTPAQLPVLNALARE